MTDQIYFASRISKILSLFNVTIGQTPMDYWEIGLMQTKQNADILKTAA